MQPVSATGEFVAGHKLDNGAVVSGDIVALDFKTEPARLLFIRETKSVFQ